MTVVLHGVDEVKAAVGRDFGFSDWLIIDQARVDAFTAATGTDDRDWLALSLSNYFLPQVVLVDAVSAGVNYGAEEVRFPTALAVGDRVRAGVVLSAAADVTGGVQTTMRITLETSRAPVAVIDSLSRYLV
jgi:acyl dehydratase